MWEHPRGQWPSFHTTSLRSRLSGSRSTEWRETCCVHRQPLTMWLLNHVCPCKLGLTQTTEWEKWAGKLKFIIMWHCVVVICKGNVCQLYWRTAAQLKGTAQNAFTESGRFHCFQSGNTLCCAMRIMMFISVWMTVYCDVVLRWGLPRFCSHVAQ